MDHESNIPYKPFNEPTELSIQNSLMHSNDRPPSYHPNDSLPVMNHPNQVLIMQQPSAPQTTASSSVHVDINRGSSTCCKICCCDCTYACCGYFLLLIVVIFLIIRISTI